MSVLQAARKLLRRKADPIDLLHSMMGRELSMPVLIHAGAHLAQERHQYEACGFRKILWIEGSPKICSRLMSSLSEHTNESGVSASGTEHHVVCSLLSDREDTEIDFYEFSNDGESSSIFHPTAENSKRWPQVFETGQKQLLRTRTLDRIAVETGFSDITDVLVVDVQGAELLVLKGADHLLSTVKAVVTEISTIPYYSGGVLFPELRSFLESRGFVPMSLPRRHGDMLFLRADLAERCL